MTPRHATTTEGASLPSVLAVLEERDLTAALVVDDAGRATGVISLTDILRTGTFALRSATDRPTLESGPITVKDVMSTPVISVADDADVLDAVRLMIAQRVHRVFVTRADAPVGVVSTRDILRIAVERHIETPIESYMSSPAETVDLGASIDEAVGMLEGANVRGLVVVDGTMPLGVFTQREAIRARGLPPVLRQQTVEAVMSYETICYDASTPLYRAAGALSSMNARRILATKQRSLVGVLSGYDLARALVTDT